MTTAINEATNSLPKFDLEKVNNWEAVKDLIVFRVVPDRANDAARDIFRREIGDTGLYQEYSIPIDTDEYGMASVLVNNGLIERWGIDEEEISQAAARNTAREAEVASLGNVISELLAGSVEDLGELPEETPECLIVTNKARNYGASMLMNAGIWDDIRERIGDFFILPSSVHEVLVLPNTDAVDPTELQKMVYEINRTTLEPGEFLSDNVFQFVNGELKIAA